MPNGNRKPKKTARKRRRPQKGTNSTAVAKVGFSSGYNLLPPKFIAKMRWNKSYQVTAGTTDIIQWFDYNLMGLYDPEVAVSSALQPNGFDQLMTEYSHYRVLGAKIRVEFWLTAGNNTIVGINTSRDSSHTDISSRDEFIVDPQTRYRIVGNDKPRASVMGYYSYKKVFDTQVTTGNAAGTATTNPNEAYIASVGLVNLAPGATQAGVDMIVTIDYIAEFSERAIQKKS